MFRRKDESATDFSTDLTAPITAAQSNGAINGAAAPREGIQAASVANVAAAPTHTTSYAPTNRAPVASNSASESGRATSTGSFRPTPVAEIGRPTPRPVESHRASPASMQSEKPAPVKTSRRVLTVGNDILLKGEIATCDRLVIEGRVEAKLSEVHTVEIAECGSFKGTAEVEEAEISGLFEGDLIVRNRIVIYATGEVRGNISYGEIEIERGGRLTGQIKTVTSGANVSKSKAFESLTETAKAAVRAPKEVTVAA